MFRFFTTGSREPLKVMEQRSNMVGEKLQNNLQRGGINGKGRSAPVPLDTQKCSLSGTVDSPSLINSAVNDNDD